jgi:hypothetical protein
MHYREAKMHARVTSQRVHFGRGRRFAAGWVVVVAMAGVGGVFGVASTSAHPGARGFGHGVIPAAAGIVEGTPGSDSFTIAERGGATETIDVSGSTVYLERGVTAASLTNVAAGDLVAVFGTLSSTVTASEVVILASPPTTTFVAAGTVQTTPASGSFVIETSSQVQLTVDVSDSTTYVERGSTSASLADVAITDDVVIFGTISGSTVDATQVVIGGNEPDRPGHFGGGGSTGSSGTTGITGSTGDGGWGGHHRHHGHHRHRWHHGVGPSTGNSGSSGPTGPWHGHGATGDSGSTGARGWGGHHGHHRHRWHHGVGGSTGNSGSSGGSGSTGPWGGHGATGAWGVTGSQGATGSSGATGNQDANGGGRRRFRGRHHRHHGRR